MGSRGIADTCQAAPAWAAVGIASARPALSSFTGAGSPEHSGRSMSPIGVPAATYEPTPRRLLA